MGTPQSGIFALGTASHAYLEFDARRREPSAGADIAALREPRTTMGGVNLVAGFRPELWREIGAGRRARRPRRLQCRARRGPGGYTMPATQRDAVLWLSGSAYDVVFDAARAAIAALAPVALGRRGDVELAVPARPRSHGLHRRHREPDADRGARDRDRSRKAGPAPAGQSCCCRGGGTTQTRGRHLPVAAQEQIIGRTKDDECRARGQARGLARRPNRPGRVREDLPPQHAVRHRDGARDDVRRLQRRAGTADADAREHGRSHDRRPGRADPLHARR